MTRLESPVRCRVRPEPATGCLATGYRLSVTATDVASVSPIREGTRTR